MVGPKPPGGGRYGGLVPRHALERRLVWERTKGRHLIISRRSTRRYVVSVADRVGRIVERKPKHCTSAGTQPSETCGRPRASDRRPASNWRPAAD